MVDDNDDVGWELLLKKGLGAEAARICKQTFDYAVTRASFILIFRAPVQHEQTVTRTEVVSVHRQQPPNPPCFVLLLQR